MVETAKDVYIHINIILHILEGTYTSSIVTRVTRVTRVRQSRLRNHPSFENILRELKPEVIYILRRPAVEIIEEALATFEFGFGFPHGRSR